MTIEEIKEECRKWAQAHRRATIAGDYKAANCSHDKLAALAPMVRSFGDTGKAMLLELAGEEDEAIACWAATYSLAFDEARALTVLEPLSKKTGPIAFTAKMVIQQWKKGELVLP